MDVDVLIK